MASVELASEFKGKRIQQLAQACCCQNLPSGRACLFPTYAEGYSEGPLVTLFILKLVNEMSQLLSVGGRQLSSSRGCVSSTRVHW